MPHGGVQTFTFASQSYMARVMYFPLGKDKASRVMYFPLGKDKASSVADSHVDGFIAFFNYMVCLAHV